ncbi:MAG: DUF4332 domain-containing protein [Planctomycetota bacterium]
MGLGVLVLGVSEAGLFLDISPFRTWFYDFAWWSWILLADGVVHLRCGSSLILSRPRAFLLLLPWSCTYWLFFEAANFLLHNWYYVGIPDNFLNRGPGTALSFATVLPAVFETAELLHSFDFFRGRRCPPLRIGPRGLRGLVFTGFAFLVAALLAPRFGFPLIWVAVALLLEPFLARRGRRGLLTLLAENRLGPLLRLLAAGLFCGILWEFWNYWAHAKWIYTVPFFDGAKIFEMPVLGFLGFAPFALECFSFGRVLVVLGLLPEWEPGVSGEEPPKAHRGWVVLALLFAVPVLFGVNRWTVHATLPTVRELTRMDEETAAHLEHSGVVDAYQLLRLTMEKRAALLEGVPPKRTAAWLEEARLMAVGGMGARGVRWLAGADIAAVKDLAGADPEALFRRLTSGPGGPPPALTRAEVRLWVRRAGDTDPSGAP